ncbi:MAG: alpha/beta hydrolase [Bacteroidota bacterium]
MPYKCPIIILFAITLVSCGKQPKTEIQAPFNYTMEGSGDTTLIFIHGLAINQTYWENQVDEFMDHYTVITLDLPGHGASKLTTSPATVEGYANNIVEFVELLDIQNVVLIGHSMAGNVELLAYPQIKDNVIGVIGVDNFQELGEPFSEEGRKKIDSVMIVLKAHYKANVMKLFGELFSPLTDDLTRKRVTEGFVNGDSIMVTQLLTSIIDNSQYERSQMKKLEVPLILIESDMFPIDRSALKENCLAGYKIFTIDSTGHYPMIERPEEFNESLRAALRFIKSQKK